MLEARSGYGRGKAKAGAVADETRNERSMAGQPQYADAKDDEGDEDFEERERATISAEVAG